MNLDLPLLHSQLNLSVVPLPLHQLAIFSTNAKTINVLLSPILNLQIKIGKIQKCIFINVSIFLISLYRGLCPAHKWFCNDLGQNSLSLANHFILLKSHFLDIKVVIIFLQIKNVNSLATILFQYRKLTLLIATLISYSRLSHFSRLNDCKWASLSFTAGLTVELSFTKEIHYRHQLIPT